MVRTPTEIKSSLFSYAVSEELLSSDFERGRIGILFAVMATEMSIWEGIDENYHIQHFIQTATEEKSIEYNIEPLYYRAPARPSNVIIKFYWTVEFQYRTDTTIPFLQPIQTAEENPVLYLTTEETVLYKDQEYTTVMATSYLYGNDTMVDAGDLIVLEPQINGISAINSEASWGGMDQESLESAKDNAMAMRYNAEKGTRDSMNLALMNLGLQPYQYNLVDLAFGNGTFALYVDTTIDELIIDIEETLDKNKAEGICYTCGKANQLLTNFTFNIKLNGKADLLPRIRDTLESDIISVFDTFILENGVGQKIVFNKAVHYLYENLLSKYEIYDIEISADNAPTTIDSDGNLILEDNEVIKVNNVTINLTIGE